MARAYWTTSSEALCLLTGMTPIIIKIEEIVKQYALKDRMYQQAENLDYDTEYKYWPHLAKEVTIQEIESLIETISVYTNGSKSQAGVGVGVIIYKGNDIIATQKLKL